MTILDFTIGQQLVLRERYIPGHPYARMDARGYSGADLPAGALGTIRYSHGSEYMVEINPDPIASQMSKKVDLWVQGHMMPVLFAPAPQHLKNSAGAKRAKR